ncbi:MAG: phospho-N-acetylmuramoyl-pentapeptide-transferase [Vampirovibrionales bacterium]|nr:phospho-N-acetylmuramoyl-pentapeptide-transferase [Vampirovibrionales bacterium]
MIINNWWLTIFGLFFVLPLGFVLVTGYPYISWLAKKAYSQTVREDGPQHHLGKSGTPTAGGLLILLAMWVTYLVGYNVLDRVFKLPFLNASWRSWESFLFMMTVTLLGLVGFVDDAIKIQKKHNKGISGYAKLWGQALVGATIGGAVLGGYLLNRDPVLNVFEWRHIQLGWWYVPYAIFTVTAFSNAVNLSDGLDGLAAGTVSSTLLAMAVLFLCPLAGMYKPELGFMALALLASTLGFLWFNRHPAKVFMGDVGSLALGGGIAVLGLLGGLDSWLILLGAIFVIETFSVILQVASFRLTGKRLFKMSPLHHHFELSGWSETKVVRVFNLFHMACCAAATFGVIWLRLYVFPQG